MVLKIKNALGDNILKVEGEGTFLCIHIIVALLLLHFKLSGTFLLFQQETFKKFLLAMCFLEFDFP